MSEDTKTPERENAGDPLRSGRWFKTPALAIVVALGLGATGIVATQAFSQSTDFVSWRSHGGSDRMRDPAAMEKRIERGIKHLAVEIDATAEQQTALIELAKGAAGDLRGLRESMRSDTAELATLLTQPSLDATAIEAFRAEKIKEIDQITSRLAAAAVEAGDVLTTEQRVKIAELIEQRRGRHSGGRSGRRH